MRSALLATTMLAVASSAHAAANFTVSANGGFADPNGQAWSMRGLNAGVQDALQGFPNVMPQLSRHDGHPVEHRRQRRSCGHRSGGAGVYRHGCRGRD